LAARARFAAVGAMVAERKDDPAAHLVRPGSLHRPEGHCRRQDDHACLPLDGLRRSLRRRASRMMLV
ncbi:MAG: hypothetical protein IKM83_04790, partial [Paludibacteraceae bacterium]|nr:hypothetical protein [Paludibacteraceae bacterium]